MTNKKHNVDWTFENCSLVGLYMVMIFAALYHLCYTLPMYHINRVRYGPLTEEHIKKFMKTYINKKAMGPRGYLMDLGLVPLDKATFKEMVKRTK